MNWLPQEVLCSLSLEVFKQRMDSYLSATSQESYIELGVDLEGSESLHFLFHLLNLAE